MVGFSGLLFVFLFCFRSLRLWVLMFGYFWVYGLMTLGLGFTLGVWFGIAEIARYLVI